MSSKTLNSKRRLIKSLLASTLVFYLTLGVPEHFPLRPAMAQFDGGIDDVINELDRDFSFGGKEEVKRDNLKSTRETNREEIQIQRNQPQTGTTTTTPSPSPTGSITFSIIEFGPANGTDSLLVTLAGQTLVTGLNANTVSIVVSATPGVSQTLSVTCLAAATQCDYEINVVSGGTINGSTSSGFQMLGAGSAPATFAVIAS